MKDPIHHLKHLQKKVIRSERKDANTSSINHVEVSSKMPGMNVNQMNMIKNQKMNRMI
jgi:hypothetical protein